MCFNLNCLPAARHQSGTTAEQRSGTCGRGGKISFNRILFGDHPLDWNDTEKISMAPAQR